jgi:hypothetical protein
MSVLLFVFIVLAFFAYPLWAWLRDAVEYEKELKRDLDYYDDLRNEESELYRK